VTSVAVRALD